MRIEFALGLIMSLFVVAIRTTRVEKWMEHIWKRVELGVLVFLRPEGLHTVHTTRR